MICRSESPYPKVRVEAINKDYAKILLEDYASEVSEDTAIHLYLYQSLILEAVNPELAGILKDISKVEMHHLFLLGEAITMLGLEPMFGEVSDGVFIPWSGDNVFYGTNLREMLRVDIAREECAIKTYERHIELIDDIYVQQLLARIIEDERIHLAIFHNYYQKNFF